MLYGRKSVISIENYEITNTSHGSAFQRVGIEKGNILLTDSFKYTKRIYLINFLNLCFTNLSVETKNLVI